MKVPSSLLRETLLVESFEGSTAYGPKYAAPGTSIKARVEGRRRTVRTADGTDVISSATATIRPEDVDAVPVQSRVTWQRSGAEDVVYEVLDVLPGEGLTRPAFYELVLS